MCDAYMGPIPLLDFPEWERKLLAAERNAIWDATQCSASIRQRRGWSDRCLCISGPAMQLDRARVMALNCLRARCSMPLLPVPFGVPVVVQVPVAYPVATMDWTSGCLPSQNLVGDPPWRRLARDAAKPAPWRETAVTYADLAL